MATVVQKLKTDINPEFVMAYAIVNSLLRRQAVEQAMGKSRSTLYRDIERGLMVKPVPIGGDRVAWPASEIDAINKARIAGKTDDQIKQLVIELELARSA